jgi:hypothetical protein
MSKLERPSAIGFGYDDPNFLVNAQYIKLENITLQISIKYIWWKDGAACMAKTPLAVYINNTVKLAKFYIEIYEN